MLALFQIGRIVEIQRASRVPKAIEVGKPLVDNEITISLPICASTFGGIVTRNQTTRRQVTRSRLVFIPTDGPPTSLQES